MTDKQQQGKPQAQGGDITHPPFPNRMTFSDMYDTLFNRDFMTQEEFKTICDAAEMYANGCLKHAAELGYQLAPTEVQKEEDVFIKALDWLASFEATHPNSEIVDKIILCDGEYYWDSDIDGDQPLSGKDLYKIFKSKSYPSPVHTIENKEDEKLK